MIVNLLIISLIVFVTLIGIVSWRIFQIRTGKEFDTNPSLYSIAEPKIENFLIEVVSFYKKATKFLYLHFLFFARNLLSLVKYIIIRIEKKFSRIINSVRGREELNKGGEASSFFKQLKEQPEEML